MKIFYTLTLVVLITNASLLHAGSGCSKASTAYEAKELTDFTKAQPMLSASNGPDRHAAQEICPTYDEIDPGYAQEVAAQPAAMPGHKCDRLCKKLRYEPNGLNMATDYPLIKHLAQHKIEFGIPANQLMTGLSNNPISHALSENDPQFLAYLLKHKADPNYQHSQVALRSFPVIFLTKSTTCARLLIEHHAQLHVNNKPISKDPIKQYTLVYEAAKQKYSSRLLRFYLEHCAADPNLVAYEGISKWTPLMHTLGYADLDNMKFVLHTNQIKKLRYLLRHGALPNSDVKQKLQEKINQGGEQAQLALAYQNVIIVEQKKQKTDAQQVQRFMASKESMLLPPLWQLVYQYDDQRLCTTVNIALAAPQYNNL